MNWLLIPCPPWHRAGLFIAIILAVIIISLTRALLLIAQTAGTMTTLAEERALKLCETTSLSTTISTGREQPLLPQRSVLSEAASKQVSPMSLLLLECTALVYTY